MPGELLELLVEAGELGVRLPAGLVQLLHLLRVRVHKVRQVTGRLDPQQLWWKARLRLLFISGTM